MREHGFIAEDKELAIFGIAENRKRALIRGLNVTYSRITIDLVAKAFYDGFIPLALVHMGVLHELDIPHWVVVVDVRNDRVAFNDPYPPKGGRNVCLSREEFQLMLDDIGTQTGLSPSVIFIKKCKR
jgi:hypothetical protein